MTTIHIIPSFHDLFDHPDFPVASVEMRESLEDFQSEDTNPFFFSIHTQLPKGLEDFPGRVIVSPCQNGGVAPVAYEIDDIFHTLPLGLGAGYSYMLVERARLEIWSRPSGEHQRSVWWKPNKIEPWRKEGSVGIWFEAGKPMEFLEFMKTYYPEIFTISEGEEKSC